VCLAYRHNPIENIIDMVVGPASTKSAIDWRGCDFATLMSSANVLMSGRVCAKTRNVVKIK
jgi:hypothetical protein